MEVTLECVAERFPLKYIGKHAKKDGIDLVSLILLLYYFLFLARPYFFSGSIRINDEQDEFIFILGHHVDVSHRQVNQATLSFKYYTFLLNIESKFVEKDLFFFIVDYQINLLSSLLFLHRSIIN